MQQAATKNVGGRMGLESKGWLHLGREGMCGQSPRLSKLGWVIAWLGEKRGGGHLCWEELDGQLSRCTTSAHFPQAAPGHGAAQGGNRSLKNTQAIIETLRVAPPSVDAVCKRFCPLVRVSSNVPARARPWTEGRQIQENRRCQTQPC